MLQENPHPGETKPETKEAIGQKNPPILRKLASCEKKNTDYKDLRDPS